jgi:hypothetical protein
MSDHKKKVEPIRFEPAGAPAVEPVDKATPRAGRSGKGPTNWALPALGGLVVLALLVFFWLPSQVDTSSVDLDTPTPAAKRAKPAVEQASPWSDAQLARERKAAQEILAQLLEQQFALEELGVEQWAAEDFAATKELAGAGDEQYRQQEFPTAQATYQQALDATLELISRADTVFEQQLAAGQEAIRSDQAEAAVTALELAVLIRPESMEAQQLLERALNLAPLLELLRQANDERDGDNLEAALALLQDATRLDPEHAGAKAQLRDIERAIARRDFNRAMTAGYAALDDGRYDEAERQFKSAQKILPAATEPQSALVQTQTSRTQAQIEAYRQRAEAAAAREAWNQAVAAYQEILDIDNTVVFARNGLADSKARAQLDRRLKQALEKPERLSNDRVYADTRALYQQALGLDKKGPLLREQLATLDQILEKAIIPVPVLLHSDEQTDVTVYKVAHLGTFRRQQLSLKPGIYTAVGVRKGYRDVRFKFTVDHTQQSQVVEIACKEPI